MVKLPDLDLNNLERLTKQYPANFSLESVFKTKTFKLPLTMQILQEVSLKLARISHKCI